MATWGAVRGSWDGAAQAMGPGTTPRDEGAPGPLEDPGGRVGVASPSGHTHTPTSLRVSPSPGGCVRLNGGTHVPAVCSQERAERGSHGINYTPWSAIDNHAGDMLRQPLAGVRQPSAVRWGGQSAGGAWLPSLFSPPPCSQRWAEPSSAVVAPWLGCP